MKNPHDIIRRPVLTEKAYTCIADKRYIFEVDVHATKTEIKQAVEAVFAEDGVKVEKVNTLRVDGKEKRQGAAPAGRRANWKKAMVKLTADSKTIEFFEGMV